MEHQDLYDYACEQNISISILDDYRLAMKYDTPTLWQRTATLAHGAHLCAISGNLSPEQCGIYETLGDLALCHAYPSN